MKQYTVLDGRGSEGILGGGGTEGVLDNEEAKE